MFAVGDMMVYNRRRRGEYYRLKKEQRASELAEAAEADGEGRASPEQVALLKEESDRLEDIRERKERGIWKRVKSAVMGDLRREDVKGGSMGIGVKTGEGKLGVVKAVENMVGEAKEVARREAPAVPVAGGLLDQHAAKAAQDVEKASRSWWDWVTRR